MKLFKTITVSTFLILFVFLEISTSYTFAQTSEVAAPTIEEESTVNEDLIIQPFSIEIEIGTQSPWTHSVPIVIKIRPNQNTTRTNITLDTSVGIEVKNKYSTSYLAIPSGQVQVYEVSVKPIVSGTYTIAATATDWGYGANFTSTDSATLTFNDGLVVTPNTVGYSTAVLIRYVILLLSSIIFGFLMYLLGKKGFAKLKIWLKPPEL